MFMQIPLRLHNRVLPSAEASGLEHDAQSRGAWLVLKFVDAIEVELNA
jgi:hypothetical protein